VSPDARVAWIFKDDPACFPPDLAARLAGRADVVFCNAGERAWLEMSRSSPRPAGQILFETRGADGVLIEDGPERFEQPVALVRVNDATGRGRHLRRRGLGDLGARRIGAGGGAGGGRDGRRAAEIAPARAGRSADP
jgi:hypothetical protein